MNKKLIIVFFYIIWFSAPAQNHLEVTEAIRTGLEHNFGILLVRNDKALAQNNSSLGNAGILPRLTLSGNRNFSVNESRQEFLTGQINERNNARSDVFNNGAQLSWTIFDGFRMFRRYDQLRLVEQKAEIQELLAVEQLIQTIYYQYYTLVVLEKRLQFHEKSLQLSEERVRLAAKRLQSGSGSRLELLQAEVDRNNDSSALFDIKDQILSTRLQLNHTLGRPPETVFTVSDNLPVTALPDEKQLLNYFVERNSLLRLAQLDEQLALMGMKEARGRFYPELNTNLAYNYLQQQSEAGFLLSNKTSGVSYGISATWNVFNGLNNRRELQNYQIMAENSKLRTASMQSELLAQLTGMFQQYQNKLRQIDLEKQNNLIAEENFKLARQRLEIGDLSGIEYREAQKNLLNASLRQLEARLAAVLLETTIRQMTGLLVVKFSNQP